MNGRHFLLAASRRSSFHRGLTRRLFSSRVGEVSASRAFFRTLSALAVDGSSTLPATVAPQRRYFSAESSSSSSTTTTAKETPPPKKTAAGGASNPQKKKQPPPPPPAEKHQFQAETRQLLDIVTHSLYTDKEVFVRELVSNASDALEKLRHLQATNQVSENIEEVKMNGEENADAAAATSTATVNPFEIRIDLDEVTSSITITDTGVGMTKEELISHLGTIARSGSKNFLQQMQQVESGGAPIDPDKGIIGQFGVGFYSAFMVGQKVEVRTQSAVEPDATPLVWSSDGSGSYEIMDLPEGIRQDRGSSVVIHLKEEHWDFCDEARIEKILKRYSNFVNFPIYLNGNRVNTLQAIWSQDPKEVSDEKYSAFYKYIANAIDDPLDIYHFRADAPIDLKVLFYIPSFHTEKYGMERMEPGVSLYSRKILIESKSPDILPEWMRFVKGVVDSEDLPLSISREKPQDTALISKIKRTLVRKFLAHLTTMAKKNNDKYLNEFYNEYAFFLKEGLCQDFDSQAQLAKLLRFETSKFTKTGEVVDDMISLDQYISRMQPEQKDIYYVVAPTRQAAVHSPYLEAFERAGVEVLILFSAIDDFVMANLERYEGRNLVSVEQGDIDLSELKKKTDDKEKKDDDSTDDSEEDSLYDSGRKLTDLESVEFCNWFKTELGKSKVTSCTVTDRLTSSPAIVTDNESGAMRRMMRMVDTSEGNRDGVPLPAQHVVVNPKHPVIVGLNDIIKTEPTLARVLAEQVFDNCLVAAGLLDDSRSMLPRLNDILICVVKGAQQNVKAAYGTSKSTDEQAEVEQVKSLEKKAKAELERVKPLDAKVKVADDTSKGSNEKAELEQEKPLDTKTVSSTS